MRFELTAAALHPDLQVIAPWRLDDYRRQFPGRREMIAYCAKHRIPVQASAKKPYSMDRNLLHISYEAGILEDPWFDAFAPGNKDMFRLTRDPADAPDRAQIVELEFRRGDCVAVNGQKLSPLEVMRKLNALAGRRYHSAVRPSPDGVADDGPRNHASARWIHPALCRDDL